MEKEVIKIVPANPEVIYVPQYNPTTVVVAGGYSSWGYWPTPYPSYYYPYPPGAAFATGLIWGAAIGAGMGRLPATGWRRLQHQHRPQHQHQHRQHQSRQRGPQAEARAWKPDKQPGQVSSPSAGRRRPAG